MLIHKRRYLFCPEKLQGIINRNNMERKLSKLTTISTKENERKNNYIPRYSMHKS